MLNLGKNRINRLDKSFVKFFNELKSLTNFCIRSNTIEEESQRHFLENAICKDLRILDIGDNFVCKAATQHSVACLGVEA